MRIWRDGVEDLSVGCDDKEACRFIITLLHMRISRHLKMTCWHLMIRVIDIANRIFIGETLLKQTNKQTVEQANLIRPGSRVKAQLNQGPGLYGRLKGRTRGEGGDAWQSLLDGGDGEGGEHLAQPCLRVIWQSPTPLSLSLSLSLSVC